MVSLVDTNILVYECDPRDPSKCEAATNLLRRGVASGELRIPHQALVEFLNAVTRQRAGAGPLLPRDEAALRVEEFMIQFPVLYPNEHVLRIALRGMAMY